MSTRGDSTSSQAAEMARMARLWGLSEATLRGELREVGVRARQETGEHISIERLAWADALAPDELAHLHGCNYCSRLKESVFVEPTKIEEFLGTRMAANLPKRSNPWAVAGAPVAFAMGCVLTAAVGLAGFFLTRVDSKPVQIALSDEGTFDCTDVPAASDEASRQVLYRSAQASLAGFSSWSNEGSQRTNLTAVAKKFCKAGQPAHAAQVYMALAYLKSDDPNNAETFVRALQKSEVQ
jgi:hypothetical protein